MADDLIFQPAARLAALLAAGKLSSVELLQACLARTKAVDGRVKAFNSYDEAGALA
jgi:aspartyl-tRNA(Asn)/glutamyl-tRNA(Gln) amidotransferase subunit A